jgi:acyl-CoA synthetase (AMP-forming)/AMP-acid ligase II
VTLVDVLRQRAIDTPRRVAFTFDGATLTYADLDIRARAVAAKLQRRGDVGERALLVYPAGLDFVAALFGCLYAGWIAVPTASSRAEHVQRVVQDAQPRAALTSPAFAARGAPPLGVPAVCDVDEQDAGAWRAPRIEPEDLAMLQYTSGSTTTPRGVVLSHANLVHNTAQIARRFEIDPRRSRGVIWLPPFHDMGLIGGIVQGVASGFPIALMSPLTFLRRPVRWLEAIARECATISGGPNFAYDLCVERITPQERAGLDLSSWEVAFNGAEPVRAATLERFCETFAECGFRPSAFYPCYGLAEATLMVTGGARSELPVLRDGMVGSGRVIDDQQLEIVDGEIWVRGPSVARGYWRQAARTCETFGARLADGRGPFLRTGDLGVVHDGELFVTGRLKSVMFVGGRNLHAEDVEQTVVGSHNAGWPGGVAAVSIETAQRERLVILQELARGSPAALDAIVRAIRVSVADEHQVPVSQVVLLRPGRIPRTSSGKVRRQECADLVRHGSLDAMRDWRLA